MKKVLKLLALLVIFGIVGSLAFSMSKAEVERTVKQIEREQAKIESELGNYRVKSVEVKATNRVRYLSEYNGRV